MTCGECRIKGIELVIANSVDTYCHSGERNETMQVYIFYFALSDFLHIRLKTTIVTQTPYIQV